MTRTTSPPAIIAVTLATGFYLNALGWLGNAVLLREEWESAYESMGEMSRLPWSPLVKELLTLVSDFVYAFALVWVYAGIRPGHPAPIRLALQLVLLLWTLTAGMTCLALVNAGFLPLNIAWKTSLWALATFVPLAFFLPFVLRPQLETAA